MRLSWGMLLETRRSSTVQGDAQISESMKRYDGITKKVSILEIIVTVIFALTSWT